MPEGHFIKRMLRPAVGSPGRESVQGRESGQGSQLVAERAVELIDPDERVALGLVGSLDPQARYRPHPEVASTIVGGEAVLVQLEVGRSFSLDGVATRIWLKVQNGERVDQIIDDLCGHYEVDRPRAERDLSLLLARLLQAGLVEPVA